MLGFGLGLSQTAIRGLGGSLAGLIGTGAGFWMGGANPALLGLWQEAGATTRTQQAGEPVGRITRAAGTSDAAQTTAAARPSLGRWPMGAKPRNLFKGSESYTNSASWLQSETEAGVVKTQTAAGRTVTYRFNGTTSTAAILRVTNIATPHAPVKADEKITVRFKARVLTAGFAWASGDGFRADLLIRDAAGALIGTVTGPHVAPAVGVWAEVVYTFTAPVGGFLTLRAAARVGSGITLTNIDLEFSEVQVESGTTPTPYQPTDSDGVPLTGYGAVRNLAMGAQAVGNAAYWPASATAAGVTSTRVGSGVEDGVDYVDIRYLGTMTATAAWAAYTAANSHAAASLAEKFTARVTARVLAGSLGAGSTGLHLEITERNDSGALGRAESGGISAAPYQETTVGLTVTASAADGVRLALLYKAPIGTVVDVTFRVKGLQFERGDVATALQLNYGPHNVTEPSVPDQWFLLNDGNDALPVTLPAGTYAIAWLTPAGGISTTTQTLATEGTIDALRGTRMADAIIRQGDFTVAERASLEALWARRVG